MKEISVTIQGVRPLLIHSDRGIDVLDPIVARLKEINAATKTKNSETSIKETEWLKYTLAFYGGEAEAPWIPSDNLLKAFEETAFDVKKTGRKDVKSGLGIAEDEIAIQFDGPRTRKAMYEFKDKDGFRPFVFTKSVRLPPRTGARVPSCRPRIPVGWKMSFTLQVQEFCALSVAEIEKIVRASGVRTGLGGWRPRFGLFTVEEFK